jgi:monofunctional glycosyltransferase
LHRGFIRSALTGAFTLKSEDQTITAPVQNDEALPREIERQPRRRPPLGRVAAACLPAALKGGARGLLWMLGGFGLLTASGLLLFRQVDPPLSALMLGQKLSGQIIDQRWVTLDQVSPHLVRAIILSEDSQFCSHRGIDITEMRALMLKAEATGDDQALRGGSTISMQVVKNLYLWPGKNLVRKALEVAITLPMEVLWSKRRIMEIYLNIAEWGPGVFGAEAASQFHFSKPASRLLPHEAALLAVALPNPFDRVAGNPGAGTKRLAERIQNRVKAAGRDRFRCVIGASGGTAQF